MGKNSIILILMVLLCISGVGYSQRPKVSFEKYHTYQDTVNYLKQVASQYRKITRLLKIGRSNQGRDIYVLVLSNMQTGTTIDAHVKLRNMRKEGIKNVFPMEKYLGKPAHFLCGSTHGNEFTGTEVCLYIIDKLVNGYQSDPGIKHLIDYKCFYICPVVNPDGLHYTLNRGLSQRYNSGRTDDDGDGKINEDGPDDLNGDGFITYFRYPDPKGRYVIDDQDQRVMVRLKKGEKTEKTRYSLKKEDIDNDKDGKIGEDSHMGVDLNRNFPEGWFKAEDMPGGQGKYPTSEPEVHALVEFFTNHRNILSSQFYHTSGGFTYRPMGTMADSKMNPWDRAVFDVVMGKRYLEIIGDDVPEAWIDPGSQKTREAAEKLKNPIEKKRGYTLPRGWKVSYDEKNSKRYSYGMATDWAYKQYGIYSLTTELWNAQKDIENFPTCEGKDRWTQVQRELLKVQDKLYKGALFVNWKRYKHPTYGEGEIGGWKPGYSNNAFPGKPLIGVCEKHWQFERFRAELLPKIKITKAEARPVYQSTGRAKVSILEVTAEIANVGKLATNVAEGATLSCNREDVIWLIGNRDKIQFIRGDVFQKLGVLEGTLEVKGFSGVKFKLPQGYSYFRRRSNQTPGMRTLGFRKGADPVKKNPSGNTRKVSWLVRVKGNPDLKVVFTSQKGGTEVRKVEIKGKGSKS